jgi:hypothetical protein
VQKETQRRFLCHQFLYALLRGADYDKEAEFVIHLYFAVDSIRPPVDELLVRDIPAVTFTLFFRPFLFEAGDGIGR